MTYLRDVRCRGCMRYLGVAKYDLSMFCDKACAEDFPVFRSEARDALLEAVALNSNVSYAVLGRLFGITRQFAAQVVYARDIAKVVQKELAKR